MVKTFSSDVMFTANPRVVSSALGDGAALLDMRANTYYTLNSVGAFVWNAIQIPTPLSRLVASVSDRFLVEASRCEADLQSLLNELVGAKLADVVDAPAG